MTYEMTIYTNGKALANRSLAKNVRIMEQAVQAGNKSGWQFAVALAEVITKKQYEDDFKKQGDFAKYIGMSNGNVSQIVNAVKFAIVRGYLVKDEKGKTDYSALTFSVSAAYLMSTLDDVNEFIKWLASTYKTVWTALKQSELKKAIKEYNARNDTPEKQEAEQEAEQEVEQEAEQEAEQIDGKEAALNTIVMLMAQHKISMKEVADYIDGKRA